MCPLPRASQYADRSTKEHVGLFVREAPLHPAGARTRLVQVEIQCCREMPSLLDCALPHAENARLGRPRNSRKPRNHHRSDIRILRPRLGLGERAVGETPRGPTGTTASSAARRSHAGWHGIGRPRRRMLRPRRRAGMLGQCRSNAAVTPEGLSYGS